MNLDKLYQVAARTDNLDESVVFYQDVLGATLMGKYDPPGIALFNFSGTRLILEKGTSPAILYFWVDDIEAACEELKGNGVNFDAEPGVVFKDDTGIFGPAGESEVMAFFKDPAGNTLALATRQQI